MKPNIITKGIVLRRTNFQEADRILTIITPDHGKISAIAKGVRRAKSKLAGGIELFSISDITFIQGRGELATLVSTRLQTHFGQIVTNIDRTMLGYELLKRINKVTEQAAGPEYFDLLAAALKGLDQIALPLEIVEFWFDMQLLHITGHAPNLHTDANGEDLTQKGKYEFDYDSMAFKPTPGGPFKANHIKLMSLGIRANQPAILAKVQDAEKLVTQLLTLAQTLLSQSVRV